MGYLQRYRVFATKVCIANRKTGITCKILQRHRFFGSKECVASGCTVISVRMKDGTALRHTLDVLRGTIVQGMMFSPSKSRIHLHLGHFSARERPRYIEKVVQLSPAPSALYRDSCENVPRHRVFAIKECIANMQPALTGKTLQRHRVFVTKECIADRVGSKECVAWK